jgi:hypothetical protein
MLKLGLIALSLVVSSLSYSQEQQKKTPEQRAALKTERLAKELLLSPEQKEKVLNLYTGIAQKNDITRKSTSLSKEQKQVAIKENSKDKIVQMKSILNEQQFAKYEAIEAKKAKLKEERKETLQKTKNQRNKATENVKEEIEEEL